MNIYATYQCNFHCKFCSIRKDHSELVDLIWVENELRSHPELCSNINILGGEPSILPLSYQDELIRLCQDLSKEPPYYITNLFEVSPLLAKCRTIVSYDFGLREHHREVFQNMLQLDIDFSISTVLTNYLVTNVGSEKYLNTIEGFKNCIRADLDIYYHAKNDSFDFTPENNQLIKFVKDVMGHRKVNLAPLSAMNHEIDSSFHNISDYFAFMPPNKYGVRLDYVNGPYRIFDTFDKAITYYNERINNNMCHNCTFLNTCWYPCSDDVCHGNKPMLEEFKKYVLSSRR